ncbi:hypothetical protein Aph01nite_57100 [Acrocarpospora phusangensis]|uniref:Uncharacterized protein n=1 Tax=Acrocarpospora phusangensis TaxID=1070424 RepID=A0A919QJC3_9ACTN|nr:hypothetical protein [Acrocarpospora phusangensis]GIH27400.1 hypothetical protein Aph01nite_57100 [Acrocarpospora phusangensis]
MTVTAPELLVAQRYSKASTRAAVTIAAAWHLGSDLPSTIFGWSEYRWPLLALGAWILYSVIGVAASVALLNPGRRLPFGPWASAGLALVSGAVVIVACRPEAIMSAANWGWGSVGWLALILFWPRRTWPSDLAVFFLINALIMLAGMAAADSLDRVWIGKFLVILFGSMTLQAGASAGAHAFDLAAHWAADNSSILARAEATQKAAEQVHADRLRRYAQARQAAAPVLTRLAEGADPSDPDVRHQCAVGAARLRRLIAETDDAPNPLLHTLRACVFDIERRGVVVNLLTAGTVPPLPLEVRQALIEAPLEALARARTQARVTLVATANQVIISVLSDAEEFVVPEPDGVRVATQVEGGLLWIESGWTAP